MIFISTYKYTVLVFYVFFFTRPASLNHSIIISLWLSIAIESDICNKVQVISHISIPHHNSFISCQLQFGINHCLILYHMKFNIPVPVDIYMLIKHKYSEP